MNSSTKARPLLTGEQLDALRALDTGSASNAIETFGIRLRNEGFTFPGLDFHHGANARSMLGYAVTCRVKAGEPPMVERLYYDRMDWWQAIESMPEPRIIVIQDVDARPGIGALVGGVHGAILKALRCRGVITNGAVRDLDQLRSMDLPALASFVSVSHAYVHIVEFGAPVEISGLHIQHGDLLLGDRHGALQVPFDIAAELPARAAALAERETNIVKLCQSEQFSLERLRQEIERTIA